MWILDKGNVAEGGKYFKSCEIKKRRKAFICCLAHQRRRECNISPLWQTTSFSCREFCQEHFLFKYSTWLTRKKPLPECFHFSSPKAHDHFYIFTRGHKYLKKSKSKESGIHTVRYTFILDLQVLVSSRTWVRKRVRSGHDGTLGSVVASKGRKKAFC